MIRYTGCSGAVSMPEEEFEQRFPRVDEVTDPLPVVLPIQRVGVDDSLLAPERMAEHGERPRYGEPG